ncbi:hypothetical protein [Acidithiobacillus sp.]|uniref:hypothetical protein n=1 Tax=Acidithiobacillus sp. TaxID=1872118 RepID=UPI003CFFC0E7
MTSAGLFVNNLLSLLHLTSVAFARTAFGLLAALVGWYFGYIRSAAKRLGIKKSQIYIIRYLVDDAKNLNSLNRVLIEYEFEKLFGVIYSADEIVALFNLNNPLLSIKNRIPSEGLIHFDGGKFVLTKTTRKLEVVSRLSVTNHY